MARQLVANVYVDGVLYGPDGIEPTPEAAEQITNSKAWAEDEPEAEKPTTRRRKA